MNARAALRLLQRNKRGPSASTATVGSNLSDRELTLLSRCRPYTMVSTERLVANIDAVEYIVRRDIPGSLLECGVWRGGSVLAMVLTLQNLGVEDRDVYLCDTFTGMTEPGNADTSVFDPPAVRTFQEAQAQGERPWSGLFSKDVFGLQQVAELIRSTGYPMDRVHFVIGPVEDTLPDQAPHQIAVLRLDTDWYTSTKHEMDHLYPRVSPGGVLIVDDYGHWDGSRRAVDEYFATTGAWPLLNRTDYAGRMAVKV